MSFIKRSIFIIAIEILLCSCMSFHEPKSIYTHLNYSEKDVYENEKKRISSLVKTNPTLALWNAVLLNDEESITNCSNEVANKFNEALSKKDYFSALKYYRSISSVNKIDILQTDYTEEKLIELSSKNVPGFYVDKENLPQSISDCINATVTVWVDRGISIKDGAGYADRVIGSGFFISSDGYIITNHHVIEDMVNPKNEKYSRLYIKLASNTYNRIPAKVIGYDALLDLALLKVEVTAPFVLALGSSEDLQIGDRVSAIGTPLGLDGTLTQGIVSNVSRNLFPTGSVLQIDAAVNSGNSGGPLIDSNMRVQAIVFAGMIQYQGLNFALPVEYLKQDLPLLFNGGKREHPWTASFGNTKKSANGKNNLGLEVQYVMPGGSMHRAHIEAGDVITAVNDRKVSTLEDMQNILRDYTSDTIIKIKYIRDEKESENLVYLNVRPKNPGYEIYNSDLISGSFLPIFGMKLAPSSTLSKKVYTITDVIEGSIADESGFSQNDPIELAKVEFIEDNSIIYSSIYTRRVKKGFLDVALGIAAPLDSSNYF